MTDLSPNHSIGYYNASLVFVLFTLFKCNLFGVIYSDVFTIVAFKHTAVDLTLDKATLSLS